MSIIALSLVVGMVSAAAYADRLRVKSRKIRSEERGRVKDSGRIDASRRE